MHIPFEITAAFGCAPDIPPKPEVTKIFPFKSSANLSIFLAALRIVIVVP